ncbi:hypothetical protein [Azospirillum argentinense]|uniref:DUF6651 domain-containing protein n=1 Tax=Azospirillum argentinense TaxID=2970906 RepID=UPI0032DE30B9
MRTQFSTARPVPLMGGVALMASGFGGHRIRFEAPDEGGSGGGGEGGEKQPDPETKEPENKEPEKKDPEKKDPEGEKKKPTDEEARLLKESMDRKKKIAELEEKLKAFEGLDPEGARAALKAQKDAEIAAAEKAGDFERVRRMMAEEHDKEKGALTGQIGERDGTIAELRQEIDRLTLGAAFNDSEFIADELVLTPKKTRQVYGDHFAIEDGRLVAYDKPAGSRNRTLLVDASGEPLGFETAIRRIVEGDPEKDKVLKSKLGQGAKSGTSGDKAPPPATAVVGKARIAAALELRNKK